MNKNIEVLLISEFDMEWAICKQYRILFSGTVIGNTKTYTFTKEKIDDYIVEDHAFYMYEDTKIKENICNLLYENMDSAKIVYIDELFLKNGYRGKGIGSIVLKEIEHLNINCSFVLLASALENIHEFIVNEDYRTEVTNKLCTFYTNNGYNHHGSVFYKGIDFSEENWMDFDNYSEL